MMTPIEFWTEFFRMRLHGGLDEARPTDAPALLASGHRALYGEYLGPSSLSWGDAGCIWAFCRCPHGDRPGTCEAHQGYLLGAVRGLGFEAVQVVQDRRDSHCQLQVRWNQP
jgi:hypothetical protein